MIHYVYVKYFLDRFPAFAKVYHNNIFVKVQIDMIACYGVCVGSSAVHYETIVQAFVGLLVGGLMLNFLAPKEKPIMINFLVRQNPDNALDMKMNKERKDEIQSVRFPFLSYFKGFVCICTCTAIMQCDMPLMFPRHQLKAEDYGWALMDVGVSATMIGSGLANKLIVTHRDTKKGKSFLTELIQAITGNLGVCLGASVRFVLLKGIDYHDHVTEWGTHWNFFLTIACLNVWSVFIRSSKYVMYYGFGMLIVFELWQQHYDMKTYIWHGPRDDMISANREGIISLPGYMAF